MSKTQIDVLIVIGLAVLISLLGSFIDGSFAWISADDSTPRVIAVFIWLFASVIGIGAHRSGF